MTAKVLDAANAAPLASDAERSGFWRMVLVGAAWVAGVLALGLCLGFGILHYGRQHLAHQAKVSAIQNPPSGSPEIDASPSAKISTKGKKSATNKIATQAINTLAAPSFSHEKAPKQPEPLTPAEQDFAKQLAIFERKL